MHKLITLLTSLVFALYFCQQWAVKPNNAAEREQKGTDKHEFLILASATNQVLSTSRDPETLEAHIESLPKLDSRTQVLKRYYLKGIIGGLIQNVGRYTDLVSPPP